MNQLKSRSSLISTKYKLENYDEVKTTLEQLYKVGVSEALIQYLIKNDKDIDDLSTEQKKKIFIDFFNSKQVKDLTIVDDEKNITFSFLTRPENLNLTDDVKIVITLENGTN